MFRLFHNSPFIRLTIVFSICLGLLSCAGRQANPVPMNMPGDNSLSKQGLRLMMSQVQSQINAKAPNADKLGSNVALGVAGAFLLIPWFFMDFSDADMIELNALRDRYNYLAILYNEEVIPSNQVMEMPTYKELAESEELREAFSKQLEAMETSPSNSDENLIQNQIQFCNSCGSKVTLKSKFCSSCGNSLN